MMRRMLAFGLLVLCAARPWTLKAKTPDPSRMDRRIPVGEVIVNGHVFLNGLAAASGSTVTAGGTIRTSRSGSAILVLREGMGVVALLPESEVRFEDSSRFADPAKKSPADHPWGIELLHGTITVRARGALAVRSGSVRVRCLGGSYSRLTATGEVTRIEALKNPVQVHVEGREFQLLAGQSLLWREGEMSMGEATAPRSQQPQRTRRRVVIPALVLGAVIVAFALTVARGEKSKVVSPVAPQP